MSVQPPKIPYTGVCASSSSLPPIDTRWWKLQNVKKHDVHNSGKALDSDFIRWFFVMSMAVFRVTCQFHQVWNLIFSLTRWLLCSVFVNYIDVVVALNYKNVALVSICHWFELYRNICFPYNTWKMCTIKVNTHTHK